VDLWVPRPCRIMRPARTPVWGRRVGFVAAVDGCSGERVSGACCRVLLQW